MRVSLVAPLVLAAVVGIVGCGPAPTKAETRSEGAAATPVAPAALATAAPTQATSPAPTPGFDWAMRTDTEERTRSAVLAYEMEDTDNQPLTFLCEEGGKRIFAGITGGPAGLSRITLTSGDQTKVLTGATEATEIEDMPNFTAQEIGTDDPLFKAFVANGWLRMTTEGQTIDMAAARVTQGKDAIEEFWAFCN